MSSQPIMVPGGERQSPSEMHTSSSVGTSTDTRTTPQSITRVVSGTFIDTVLIFICQFIFFIILFFGAQIFEFVLYICAQLQPSANKNQLW